MTVVTSPREEVGERFASEQVWVQCGSRGRIASARQALDVAEQMMVEQRKRVASLHVSECDIVKGRVCTCNPYVVRGNHALDRVP